MAVPGTPSLMVRKRSASEFPCFFCARVRSGPRPPPRAPSPWQKAQFALNSNSPAFAAAGSLASGFLSCAFALIEVSAKNNIEFAASTGIRRREIFEAQRSIDSPRPDPRTHRQIYAHYITEQLKKR